MITASHGSGYDEQIQPAHITSIDIVFADGSTQTLNKKDDSDFYSYVINFGCVGIITKMSLSIIPAYKVNREMMRYVSWDAIKTFEDFDKLNQSAQNIDYFFEWDSKHFDQIYIGSRYANENEETPESKIKNLP